MSDNLDPFESPSLLLDAAEISIDEVELGCAKFVADCTGPLRRHKNPQTGEEVIYITLKNVLPSRIRTLTSQIVDQIKHSLDQATCDAAIMLGRPNAKGVYFPIAKTVADFHNEAAHRLRGVDPLLRDYLVQLNTNELGNPGLYNFLKLCGPNKHQRIVGLTAKTNASLSASQIGFFSGPMEINVGKWHRTKNEIEWIRVGPGGAFSVSGTLQDALKPSVRVVLLNGKPPFDKSLPDTLGLFLKEVRGIVSQITKIATRAG